MKHPMNHTLTVCTAESEEYARRFSNFINHAHKEKVTFPIRNGDQFEVRCDTRDGRKFSRDEFNRICDHFYC